MPVILAAAGRAGLVGSSQAQPLIGDKCAMRWLSAIGAVAVVLGMSSLALAAGTGGPEPWQLGLRDAATPIMERVASFHTMLMWIITLITIFVLGLLIYVCVKFKAEANPTPSRRTHHVTLEIAWTAIPVLILVIMAIPSFKLLYYSDVVPETEMTVKAIGRQWYWSYEYPDNGNFTFDAYMLADDELTEGQLRLLETDYRVVLPAQTNVRIQVTSSDVLHAWAVPSAGVKIDAVPGRLNEIWVNFNEAGTYYGQCSELCGVNHGFMPIAIDVMAKEDFDAWVSDAQAEFAKVGEENRNFAAAE